MISVLIKNYYYSSLKHMLDTHTNINISDSANNNLTFFSHPP